MTTMISWVKRALAKLTDHQEKELIKKSIRGDREAFGKLYSQYVDQIYRYIYFKTYQNEVVAQDLTQTVFLKAWNNIGGFNTFDNHSVLTLSKVEQVNLTGSFKAWLYQIARNAVVDEARSKKPNSHLDNDISSETSTLEEQMNTLFIKEHVREALNHLPDDQRELVILKFIEDMSNSEIATLLGKSEDAVRAQQHRAFKQLRKILATYVKH